MIEAIILSVLIPCVCVLLLYLYLYYQPELIICRDGKNKIYRIILFYRQYLKTLDAYRYNSKIIYNRKWSLQHHMALK
jgi:hypothetical protein